MSACTEKACVTPKPQCIDGETTNDGVTAPFQPITNQFKFKSFVQT